MAYKHTFSFSSDGDDIAIVLATINRKRKRHQISASVIEPFPNTYTYEQQIEILKQTIEACEREIRRLDKC